jgi:hypothetical protein
VLGQGFAADNVAELRSIVAGLQGATIRTTIPLDQPLPLKGAGVIVPVDQQTTVTLVEPVPLQLSGADIDLGGYRARIRNHGHSCFLCEIVIRSQFHTTYEPEA